MSTSAHIHGQRIVAKAFGALSSFARYSIKAKYQDHKSESANKQRLMFKAFKSWQRYQLSRGQKVSVKGLADQLRSISLQRQAMVQLRQFMVMSEHKSNLRKCSTEFRNLCLKRTTMRSLSKYMADKLNSYKQKANVRAFYEANLKAKLIRLLHETNLEFIKHFV